MVSGALGCVVSLLTMGLWLAILVIHVVAIVKGVNGGRVIIPGASAITLPLLTRENRGP